MSKNNDALNGAKARIVTLTRNNAELEEFNARLQARVVVAERRHESAVNQLLLEQDAVANLRALNINLGKKAEKATIWAITFGLLMVITIGTIAGGLFA